MPSKEAPPLTLALPPPSSMGEGWGGGKRLALIAHQSLLLPLPLALPFYVALVVPAAALNLDRWSRLASTASFAQYSALVAHQSLLLPLPFALPFYVALVMLLLAFRQPDLELDLALLQMQI